MLRYGIYRFVMADSAGAQLPLIRMLFDQFEGWRFDPNDKTLVLEFYLDFRHQAEALELGIAKLARNVRQKLNLRPETKIKIFDKEQKILLVEDQGGVVRASR